MKISYVFLLIAFASTIAFAHSSRGLKVIMDNGQYEKLAMNNAKLPVMMEFSSTGSLRINTP